MTGPVPSESTTSSSSSIELAMDGACGGAGFGAPARAISADPATKSGWLVLMYAAWIEIKLETYSDVGPSRSRSSSETTSISWACSRGNRCSSWRSVKPSNHLSLMSTLCPTRVPPQPEGVRHFLPQRVGDPHVLDRAPRDGS